MGTCIACAAPASKQCAKCPEYYCSRECQLAAWQEHKFTCSANVEVRPVEGSGMGVFARRAFIPGDCLVREKPLFVNSSAGWSMARSQEHAEALSDAQVTAQVPLLPDARRAAVMQLADVFSADSAEATPAGIARTNSIPVGDDGALFALSARFNHSCLPSARWCWRADLGCLLIFAMRPIAAGEQVTIAYSKTFAEREKRVRHLQAKFKFTCACPLCSGPADPKADDRMIEIQALIDAMPEACKTDHARALELSERTLQLLVDAGLDTPITMGTCHYEAYQLARSTGKKAKAGEHLLRAFELAKLSDGADSPLALQYGALVTRLASK